MSKKKLPKSTAINKTYHYPSDLSGEQLKVQMEEVLRHLLTENRNHTPNNTAITTDEKYEKEKRELELEEKRQALKHNKINSRVGVGTLLTTIFSAILSLFSFFAKPEVKTERLIIQESDNEKNEQEDARRFPRPLDPPHELLILKRIASEFPAFKDKLQTAQASLETGGDPFYVQKNLVDDLSSLRQEMSSKFSSIKPKVTYSNIDQAISYFSYPTLKKITLQNIKSEDKKD